MYFFKNPHWLEVNKYDYDNFNEIPNEIFDITNVRLDTVQSEEPLVSIIIAAWNEELNILNCIMSLSRMITNIPFEIIVVNNNSTDDTQKILNKLNIKKIFQEKQGCGPARQLGQENAKGKYILLADADCVYPTCWLDKMVKKLHKPNVVCVYGRYSFIGEPNYPRWKLFFLEKMKDSIATLRHFKRPYLNAYGISMGYVKELGLKVGFIDHNTRGEDGRLCFDLMAFGKVKQVTSNASRPWTPPRTLQRDGSFEQALLLRIKIELRRFFSLFTPHPPHDTKKSKNE